MKKIISQAVIKRLPRYYRTLELLSQDNVQKVSSKTLAEKLDITASQVRQDFSNFGGFGQQGYGYEVEKLKNEFKKILGLDKTYNMIVVGAGNIGKAISSYKGFKENNFNVIDLFDLKEKSDSNVKDIDSLDEHYIESNDIKIAAITVTRESAQEVADKLVEKGIKNIWNFAAVDIDVPKDVKVENIFMSDSLFVLSYRISKE